jgi:hypothetical protein
VPATPAETDPSVCYRHPDRSSWTLCERCGRTICPECQILTPSGVRCPDCVRETGGSVQWQPAAGPRPAARAKKTGMRRSRPSVGAAISATSYPVVTITTGAIAIVLWVLGLFTGNLPFELLAATPQDAWQVWRYATSAVAYPAFGAIVIFLLLSIAIFTFIGWGAERQFGRRRFLELLIATAAGSAAFSMVAGSGAAGLMGPIWGLTGAFLITVWPNAPARNRILISVAIWLIISIFLGGNILAIIGGTLAGVGAQLVLRHYEGRRSRPWLPHVWIAAGVALLIVLAILRNFVPVALA